MQGFIDRKNNDKFTALKRETESIYIFSGQLFNLISLNYGRPGRWGQ